jgi:Putative peptidoglycan binding domain
MSFSLGSKGDEVMEIQARLNELGFNPGPMDGVYGTKTQRAVAAFQESQELEMDGIAGPVTLSALGLTSKARQPETERVQFNELLLMNPNYFGNLKTSDFKPVKRIQANASYEELRSLGYHPHLEMLEAVVCVKKAYGYKGSACTDDSREYVRFYMDWENDDNWQDMGMAQFTAYDHPRRPCLEYAVTLTIDPKTYFYIQENLPRVRAILSWNTPPPPNEPDYVPVWGNTLEARIQIDTLSLLPIKDLGWFDGLEVPDLLKEIAGISQPASPLEPDAFSLAELSALYRDKGVQPHRYAFEEIKKVLAKPEMALSDAFFSSEILAELNINAGEMLSEYLKSDGSTEYEELEHIGYDPVKKGLVGTFSVKRPWGYLGNLSKKGSREFAAFWEWDESENSWGYLGTTSVRVHDAATNPDQGLQYAVFLPVDLSHRQRLCKRGGPIVKIRGILSWNERPQAHDAHWIPKWGNRQEAQIHLQPEIYLDDDPKPYIDTISGMNIRDINQANGLAAGDGAADESPFGGSITITGFINNAPKYVLEGTQQPLKYRVCVRPYDPSLPRPWQPLTNEFNIKVLQQTSAGSLPQKKTITQKPDPVDGYYTYLEDVHGTAWRRVDENVLAKWNTGSSMSGKWQIKLEAKNYLNHCYPASYLMCEDGIPRTSFILALDNAKPDPVTVTINGVQRGGAGPVDDAVAYDKFQVGDILHGTYKVGEGHFKRLTFNVHPVASAGGAAVPPPERSYNMVPATGMAGTWTLNTAGMAPCAYLIRLRGVDRTIARSAAQIGWQRYDEVGFCLIGGTP